jgi:hypothetical protein
VARCRAAARDAVDRQQLEQRMKSRGSIPLTLAAALLGCGVAGFYAGAQTDNQTTTPNNPAAPHGDTGVSGAIEQKLILSPAQRTAIYEQASKDKSKVAPKDFSPVIGADVPPMIELYTLPEDATVNVPAAKLYKYTMVENKVVLVDPTKMRVVDVIGPPPAH